MMRRKISVLEVLFTQYTNKSHINHSLQKAHTQIHQTDNVQSLPAAYTKLRSQLSLSIWRVLEISDQVNIKTLQTPQLGGKQCQISVAVILMFLLFAYTNIRLSDEH